MGVLVRSQVRDFFIKRHLKRTSLIEDKAMITVTNIHFYDIEESGTLIISLSVLQPTAISSRFLTIFLLLNLKIILGKILLNDSPIG